MNAQSLSANLSSRLVEAYLGHRLNGPELVDLLRKSREQGATEDGAAVVEDTFAHYSDRETDWRGETTAEQQAQALEELGLTGRFAGLRDDQVWSAEDRAIYRRLSQPEFDPATDPPAEPPTALDRRLLAVMESNFSAWDRDGNIRLDKQELDYLMSGGFYGEKLDIANDPETAAALATVLRYHSLLGSGDPADGPALSLADLHAWSSRPDRLSTGAMNAVNQTYQEYLERAQNSSTLPLSEERIDGQHLHQGVVGSCVYLSTIVGSDPADLAGMFTEGSEPGSYDVQFPDGKKETVREPSLAERLFHSHGVDGERWPAILEIAAAQRLLEEGGQTKDGLRGVIEGIDPEFALPAMTGRPALRSSLDEISPSQTRELLRQGLSSGGPVICGSRPAANGDFINVEELHNGIANSHCYSIQGYDPESDRVTLQNPWHKGEWKFAQDGQDDGVFEMPLRDFYASFRWVTYAPAA